MFFSPSATWYYFAVRWLDIYPTSAQHVIETGLNQPCLHSCVGMALRPSLSCSVILLSTIEMLLKMSFYRSLSYFVNACFLNSARRHVKCFHLHLKIWLFLQLTCLSEVPRTTVPRIYPHISRKLLDSCFISQNFSGFFFKPSFTSKLYQQMYLGGVKAWGILSLLRAFCCVACRVETLSRKLQWATGVINLVDWL